MSCQDCFRLVIATDYGKRTYKEGIVSTYLNSVTNQSITDAHEYQDGIFIKYAERFHGKDYSNTKKMLGAGESAYFNWLMDEIDEDLSADFFEKFESGEGLVKGDPIFLLRNKLAFDSSFARNTNYVKIQKAAYLIKCWNSLRTGKEIKVLRHSDHESFPVLL